MHDYKVHRSQFADDICDFTSAKHTRFIQQQLQNSIDQITTYSGIYRIGLNAGKTAQIFFPGKCHTSEKNIKHVTINNTNIPIFTFDSSLSFKTHINMTASKAKHRIMRLHTIYNQSYGPSPATMPRLYKTFVRIRPHHYHHRVVQKHNI